jgi:hypothetical protein
VYQPFLIKAQIIGKTSNCGFSSLPTPLLVEVAREDTLIPCCVRCFRVRAGDDVA